MKNNIFKSIVNGVLDEFGYKKKELSGYDQILALDAVRQASNSAATSNIESLGKKISLAGVF